MRKLITLALACLTLVAAPLAYSAPGGSVLVTQYRSYLEGAYGGIGDGYSVQTVFWAFIYDDSGNVAQGDVGVQQYDWINYTSWSITCTGPAYASAVDVNEGNGNSFVNVVLDPASPDCVSENVNAPITIALSGRADGYYINSSRGHGMYQEGGHIVKYDQTDAEYSEVFDGTVGEWSGFGGTAQAGQRRELLKEK